MPNQHKTIPAPPLRCSVPGMLVSAANLKMRDTSFESLSRADNPLFTCHIALQQTGIARHDLQISLYTSSCIRSSGTQSRSCQ
jgi:hypothetical protein